jgi:hypothetical protein
VRNGSYSTLEELRNANKILVENLKGRDRLGDLSVDEGIMLK